MDQDTHSGFGHKEVKKKLNFLLLPFGSLMCLCLISKTNPVLSFMMITHRGWTCICFQLGALTCSSRSTVAYTQFSRNCLFMSRTSFPNMTENLLAVLATLFPTVLFLPDWKIGYSDLERFLVRLQRIRGSKKIKNKRKQVPRTRLHF